MKKAIWALLGWMLFTCMPAHAEEASKESPWDWQISARPKPTQEEIELERWAPVFATDMANYEFDRKSLFFDKNDPNVVHVLTRTTFTNAKTISSLTKKYHQFLQEKESIAYSEALLAFQIQQKTYEITELKLFSNQHRLIEEKTLSGTFRPITEKTFAEAMFNLAKIHQYNNIEN